VLLQCRQRCHERRKKRGLKLTRFRGHLTVNKEGVRPRRRHSALEYLSPMNFESKHASRQRTQHGLPTVGVCVAGATPPVDNPALEDLEELQTSVRNSPRKAVNSNFTVASALTLSRRQASSSLMGGETRARLGRQRVPASGHYPDD
jgi:hypothetical protein